MDRFPVIGKRRLEMEPIDKSTPQPFDVMELIERQRAIERQNAETFKTHNTITALICVAWIIFVCGFMIFGPDVMNIRDGFARVETSEDATFVILAIIATLIGCAWVPLYLFVGWRRRWPPVIPYAVVRAQGKE